MSKKLNEHRESFEQIITLLVEKYQSGDLHTMALTFMDNDGVVTSMCGGCSGCMETLIEDIGAELAEQIENATETEPMTMQ